MPIVEPHLYADTPIFREMLYEREGRFPGTPEGEGGPEDSGAPVTPSEPLDPSGDSSAKLVPVPLAKKAVVPVEPVPIEPK